MPWISLLASATLLWPLPATAFTPEELHRLWPDRRAIESAAPCLRHADLVAQLETLARRHPERLRLETAGSSVQGRSIHLVTVGRGERKVLLWSQMHGDEPSATPALLDIVEFLLTSEGDAEVEAILEQLTLLIVPMLNPDGAEVYTRRNAQGIDINRDALNLTTPEGRLLKQIRDRHQPILGFNLHDQNRRRTAGPEGTLATNAVLAVSGDRANTLTPGRLRAKRACAAIVDALARFHPGGMARYDEEFSPRSFGDNLTAWGTPVVLIESGGLPGERPYEELTRTNFVAILSALAALATNDLADFDPATYDQLPDNHLGAWADVVVRGGRIRQPGSATAYRADLAFDRMRDDRVRAACADRRRERSEIADLGDARLLSAEREIDAEGLLILAPFEATVNGWSARKRLQIAQLRQAARAGFATVRWSVPARRLADAHHHARRVSGAGRARLSVELSATPRGVELAKRIVTSDSTLLGERLRAVLGERQVRELIDLPTAEGLNRLWSGSPTSPHLRLLPERPASFLLVTPGAGGDADLEGSRIVAVWLDGHELGTAAP